VHVERGGEEQEGVVEDGRLGGHRLEEGLVGDQVLQVELGADAGCARVVQLVELQARDVRFLWVVEDWQVECQE